MQQDLSDQIIELKHEIPPTPGVFFDDDNVRLEGVYTDQVSAYRAKRTWIETLGDFFMLEFPKDMACSVSEVPNSSSFVLRCEFKSACARYAFWRLVNAQAPEAQYILETAHIPQCESRRYDFLTASDLRDLRAPTSASPGLSGSLRLYAIRLMQLFSKS